MQQMNWDDLRILVAMSRSCSFQEAGKLLGVDGTTVARRIYALENLLESRLVARDKAGALQFTDLGLKAINAAKRTEEEVEKLQDESANGDGEIRGAVTISSVPIIINQVLMPALKLFAGDYPNLTINLLADNKNLSLADREIDLAVRLARPVEGGYLVKGHRAGTMDHGVFVGSLQSGGGSVDIPWISYLPAMAHLPQAQWIEEEVRRTGGTLSNIQVADFSGALEAVAHGCGRSVFPKLIGDNDPRLRDVNYPKNIRKLQREVWVLRRAGSSSFKRITTVMNWLDQLFK